MLDCSRSSLCLRLGCERVRLKRALSRVSLGAEGWGKGVLGVEVDLPVGGVADPDGGGVDVSGHGGSVAGGGLGGLVGDGGDVGGEKGDEGDGWEGALGGEEFEEGEELVPVLDQ